MFIIYKLKNYKWDNVIHRTFFNQILKNWLLIRNRLAKNQTNYLRLNLAIVLINYKNTL